MENVETAKRKRSNEQTIHSDIKTTNIKQEINPIESLKNQTDHILSIEAALNEVNKETQNLINLQFYEDKNQKIEKLEKFKEEMEAEFKNISSSYQNDEVFISLLEKDNEFMNAYLRYVEVYANFSNRIRETIEGLISESFSPYIYQDSKFLYSMSSQMNKTELVVYDIEKSQQNKINIDLHETLTCDEVSVVQLPNNELFCIGNKNEDIGYACIIDLNSHEIKRILPSTTYLHRSGIFYYQQNVYMFGGMGPLKINPSFGNGFPAFIEEETFNRKFDLIKNKWTRLPPLPSQLCTSSSAVPFKQRIILSALEFEHICEYDINLGSFTEFEFYTGPTEKLLIAGNSRVYLIESWICLWESEYDNEYIWKNIGKFDGNLFTAQSYRLISDKKVYLGTYDIYSHPSKFLYYELNLEEKELKKIQNFEGPIVELSFFYTYD